MWEEEFAIVIGSEGAYGVRDVKAMTPEKRAWVLRRIRRRLEQFSRRVQPAGEPR